MLEKYNYNKNRGKNESPFTKKHRWCSKNFLEKNLFSLQAQDCCYAIARNILKAHFTSELKCSENYHIENVMRVLNVDLLCLKVFLEIFDMKKTQIFHLIFIFICN